MLNPIYDGFPDHVSVGDYDLYINTDFRCYMMLLDGIESDDDEKKERALSMILGECQNIQFMDMNHVMSSVIDFLTRKQLQYSVTNEENNEDEFEAERNAKPHYSFQYDFTYIYSAFLHIYKIDLSDCGYMHWWKFMALFDGLPESTEIKQRMMYRGTNPSEIKDEKERKRVMDIQRRIMLPGEIPTDEDIGNAFW